MNDTSAARGLGFGIVVVGCVALATCAALAEPPRKPATLKMPVTGAYDADTLYSRLDSAPGALARVSIRLDGVDTPERGWRAKCHAERDLAERARWQSTRELPGLVKGTGLERPATSTAQVMAALRRGI